MASPGSASAVAKPPSEVDDGESVVGHSSLQGALFNYLKKRSRAGGSNTFDGLACELESENFSNIFEGLQGKLDSQALVLKGIRDGKFERRTRAKVGPVLSCLILQIGNL